jgi:hypothetical protein
MSAESPRRSRSLTRSGGGSATVAPQQVTDPTILDSVAGFINEVVPTVYNVPTELDDKIQWAHFEQIDQDDAAPGLPYDGDNVVPPPLILVLGYTTGIQIWAIPATGEATEILSWRHSTLRVLRLIPTPFKTGGESVDLFASSRPLIALCDSVSNYSTLTFRSLKGGVPDPVHDAPSPLDSLLYIVFFSGETDPVQNIDPERVGQSTLGGGVVPGENRRFRRLHVRKSRKHHDLLFESRCSTESDNAGS